MHCPIDSTTLVMSERNGIEIDYCPQCRGVWLDRGELDKIVERAATPVAGSRADRRSDDDPRYDRRRRDDDDDEGGIAGFLGNLFG